MKRKSIIIFIILHFYTGILYEEIIKKTAMIDIDRPIVKEFLITILNILMCHLKA